MVTQTEEKLKKMEQGWTKGPWTPEEDRLLSQYVEVHGEGRWTSVAIGSGLNRNGKSCRLRWVNYLRPGLKRCHLSPQEEAIIIELHALWGNRWSTIARYLPGRTDNEIKNYWRTHFKKPKLEKKLEMKKTITTATSQKQPKRKAHNNNKTAQTTSKYEEKLSDEQNQMMMKPCGREDSAVVFADPDAMADHQCFLYEDFTSWAAVAAATAEDVLWSGVWDAADQSDQVLGGSSLCLGEDDSNIFCNGGFFL